MGTAAWGSEGSSYPPGVAQPAVAAGVIKWLIADSLAQHPLAGDGMVGLCQRRRDGVWIQAALLRQGEQPLPRALLRATAAGVQIQQLRSTTSKAGKTR